MTNLFPVLNSIQLEIIPRSFYAHVDKTTLGIVGVSPQKETNQNIENVEISEKTAVKFLSGIENLSSWVVVFENKEYSLEKKSTNIRFKNNRVDVLSLQLLKFDEGEVVNPDIKIVLDTQKDEAIISYNGDLITHFKNGINFYFTREDDPSFLKKTFTLSDKLLSHLSYEQSLDHWPKEVLLPIEDIDDISVFTIKYPITISLTKI